jgi:PAS domain S-box-containing protein
MMTLDFFLNIIVQIFFLAVTTIVIVAWRRVRDKVHFNIALMFLALFVAMLADDLQRLFPGWGNAPVLIYFMALAAHPYLVVRVAMHVRPVSRKVHTVLLAGLALVWLALIFNFYMPAIAALALTVFFAVVETYAIFLLLSAAARGATAGASRPGLRLAAIGAISFSLVFFIAILPVFLSIAGLRTADLLQPILSPALQTLALCSGLLYYVGFAQPGWAQKLWQPDDLNRRYRDTLDHMMEGCQIIGFDWRYLYINRSALVHAEKSADELIGHTMMEAYPGIENTELFAAMKTCMEHRAPCQMENLFRYPDGHEAWFDLSIQPAPEGIFVLSMDTSERKRAHIKLSETVAKLERNNRELQEFAYVASHDLQEPLRKIQAFGDRLKRLPAALDEKGLDYMERMQAAALRMERLIDDLLSFSRVTTKAQPFVSTNLHDIATGIATDFRGMIDRAGGSIEVGTLPVANVDAQQIRLVFQNLIANAIKFQEPGAKPVVHIRSETNGQKYTVFVQDNGIGFDEKYLDRIFSPFQRLHPKGEYQGTGIGLAIVRKIVERHDGNVSAKSEPGKGATFVMTLPFSPGA